MSGHRARMSVDGMTCAHCETAVKRALEGAGASEASADFRCGEATFDLPTGVEPEALERAVRAAGYQPRPVERIGRETAHAQIGGAEYDYDLAIIGSGGGAFAAAIRAVGLGARVAMIERGTLGGTCVNVGCVPSKTLLRGVETYHRTGHHPFEGALAVDNALSGAKRSLDFSALPGVIFSDPQVATVGLTEQKARERGLQVETSVLPLKAVPRALVNHDTLGVIKLVADANTNRLLGAHIVAENAGDVIYAATLAVRFGLTVSDLADNFAPYLTMSEGLKLAAQTFGRDVSKLSCCAA